MSIDHDFLFNHIVEVGVVCTLYFSVNCSPSYSANMQFTDTIVDLGVATFKKLKKPELRLLSSKYLQSYQ